jgi:hypothetical protein
MRSRIHPRVFLALLVVVILLGVGLYFYKTNSGFLNLSSGKKDTVSQKNLLIGNKDYAKIKEEIKSDQKNLGERLPLADNCLFVSPTDPRAGIVGENKVREGVNDYVIEGKVLKVEESEINGCLYTIITIESTVQADIQIPSRLLALTNLGEVSPLIFKNHIGERVQLRLRYKEERSAIKILEWQPIVFFKD